MHAAIRLDKGLPPSSCRSCSAGGVSVDVTVKQKDYVFRKLEQPADFELTILSSPSLRRTASASLFPFCIVSHSLDFRSDQDGKRNAGQGIFWQ